MCRMLTQTYYKNVLSMCVAMCVFISCNIYVVLGARGLLTIDMCLFICNSLTRDTVYYAAIYYISINNNNLKIIPETTERRCKYL